MKRIFKYLRAKVSNVYEAARWSWADRSWLNATVQDARFDADSATRLEIVRKSRDFERNDGIANRLGDVFEQFVVGPTGLAVIPSSKDEVWNQATSVWWGQWCRYPDMCSLQPLSILQSLWARSWFFDGEVFIWKTYSKETGKPRLQTFEGHRVSTRPKDRENEGKTVIDGIQINASGRPIGYWVSAPTKGGQMAEDEDYRLIPAEEMIHIFEPSRPGQMRGLPMLYPVINDLHDLSDLQILQKRKSKDGSKITNVITTATGEAPTGTMRRARHTILTADAGQNAVTKQPDAFYDVTLGAYELRLKKGETAEQFKSESPSVAEQAFWEYLTARICAGVGISKLLVLPSSMQGTVVRADLDIATAFFRSRSEVMATAMLNIYEWAIGWAAQFDRQMDGAPKGDLLTATIRPPRSVNVDIGRNSSAMISEVQAGLRTMQDVYAEAGLDWREEVEQRAKEQAFIQAMATKYKVDAALIAAPAQTAAQAATAEPDTDDADSVPIKQKQSA